MKLTRRLQRLEALLAPANEPPMLEIVAIDSATGEVIRRSTLERPQQPGRWGRPSPQNFRAKGDAAPQCVR